MVLEGITLGNELRPMLCQQTEFAHRLRRYPNRGQQMRGQQLGEYQGILLIGFAGAGTNEFNLGAVGNSNFSDMVAQLVMEFPGVGGCFQSDVVVGA